MNIPKKFELGGTTWTVKFVRKVSPDNDLGNCDMVKAVIRIRSSLSDQIKQTTFYHELVHAILFTMGKHTEPHNEDFVDGFGQLLYQYIKTAT